MLDGYITGCLGIARNPDDVLFEILPDGNSVIPRLDRYAIIPLEEYHRLREKAGEPIRDGEFVNCEVQWPPK